MIKERIEQLRALMKTYQIDAYYVPTADFHESEYVGDYFKCREYLTGFSGSAGMAVITSEAAGLWTDGRYFVQAEQQLEGSGVTLYRMGQPETPSISRFLQDHIPSGGTLGFDGRVVNAETARHFRECLKEKQVSVCYEHDLVGQIWPDRPQLPAEQVWLLEQQFAGKTADQKLKELRETMKKESASYHLITNLDDIMWLLNIRGNDIPCNPVALSYLAVSRAGAVLFIQKCAVSEPLGQYFRFLNVELQEYDQVYDWVKQLKAETILLEQSKVNDAIYSTLEQANTLINKINPTSLAKAVKNPVEIENMKQAHIKDGVAVTKFIYWLKHQVGRETISEISAADYLEQLRQQQEGYLEPSFDTISAYREHGAIVHYHATTESDKELEPSGFYLVDSGGQYLEGTTDITRTVALGDLTDEQKTHFTLVLMGMLRLGNAKFLSGCSGITLDYIAREPLWERGLNYDHGTGHGIGYLLNVHERPNGIRYRVVPERMDSAELKPGMITSDEPGIYIPGSHGIRIENLILCKELEKTSFGQFLGFEFLTYVPIDLDAVELSLLEPRDLEYLNRYHQQVYQKISPYLDEAEQKWLAEVTRAV